MSERWELRLFVVGGNEAARRASANLARLLREYPPDGTYRIDVIDILEHPEAAFEYNIRAAPTLVRRAPTPEVRLIGDLSNTALVQSWLGLPDRPAGPEDTSGSR